MIHFYTRTLYSLYIHYREHTIENNVYGDASKFSNNQSLLELLNDNNQYGTIEKSINIKLSLHALNILNLLILYN